VQQGFDITMPMEETVTVNNTNKDTDYIDLGLLVLQLFDGSIAY